MANPGANVPHRTPRKRALEFAGGNISEPNYNAQAGTPPEQAGGQYHDTAKDAVAVSSSKSNQTAKPYSLKGG